MEDDGLGAKGFAMKNVMQKINMLNDDEISKFKNPAHRIMEASEQMFRSFHANPIQRDFSSEFEAIAAWSTVTCCYSGIEQALKCLLKMQGTFIDKPAREGGHRHHDIGKLFKDLAPEEQDVLRVSYGIYRSLHDCIPPETVDCFLDGIDKGYTTWRYFLLDGRKSDDWPTPHPGAMVDIWSALSNIICARVYCNHGLQTVKQRIDIHLREEHIRAERESDDERDIRHINEILGWQQRDCFLDINVYSSLLYCHGNGKPLHVDPQSASVPEELTRLPVLKAFTRNVRQRKNDNDLSHFQHRAETSRIVWNSATVRFETDFH